MITGLLIYCDHRDADEHLLYANNRKERRNNISIKTHPRNLCDFTEMSRLPRDADMELFSGSL